MPDVGGFSRHVRSRDDGEFLSFGAEVGVIGNESGAFAELIEHGMATLRDMEDIGIRDLRAAVVVKASGFSKGTENIKDRKSVRGFLQAGEFRKDGGAKFRKNFDLAGAGTFLGAEDLSFDFFEFGCDEALAAHGGLFANIVIGNRAQIGFCDFDEVAEDRGEADFERFDAGAFDFLFLESGDPVFSFMGSGAEFIEGRIEAGLNETPFADCGEEFPRGPASAYRINRARHGHVKSSA